VAVGELETVGIVLGVSVGVGLAVSVIVGRGVSLAVGSAVGVIDGVGVEDVGVAVEVGTGVAHPSMEAATAFSNSLTLTR
jgi:hypothetical protein